MTRSPREEILLNKCLAAIESRLGWGDSSDWTMADFEKLSDIIFDATGVRLSVTTLKRVWGKVKYNSKPTSTTLDTLARFNGYDSWRIFAHRDSESINQVEQPNETHEPSKPVKRLPSVIWLSGIAASILVFIGIISFYKESKKALTINPSKFSFSANKMVSEGVPNSVIFTYDASASPSDSIYIVQTWDITRKTLVPKKSKNHSAIYYYPGFFRTKLIIDSTVVKTHDLQISTDGWLALVEDNPRPVYFDKNDYLKNGMVEVDQKLLQKNNVPLLPHPPKVRLFNQGDLGNLMNDNFVFETEFKNDFNQGDNACQFVEVLIQCKDDIIIIPLSAKTCVGELFIYAGGTYANSKTTDLSAFGCNLTEWTKLRVNCVNKQMKFFVNDKEAYSLSFPNDPTGIVGVQYRFNGTCAVKNARFYDRNSKLVELKL